MTSSLKTAALLGLLSAVFLYFGQLLGGQGGLMTAFLFAVVMNVGSYWFSDKIVLRMYRAQEVGAGHPLYQVTAELVQRAQLPMPKVYVIPDQSPNAFATGRNPQHAAVAATEGIIRLLSRDELAGVMAHELAHVKHRDILISSVAATIARGHHDAVADGAVCQLLRRPLAIRRRRGFEPARAARGDLRRARLRRC